MFVGTGTPEYGYQPGDRSPPPPLMVDDAHPFDRLGMGRSERIGFWDGYADSYSSFQQGDIPGRIVRRLADIGFVSEDSSVLEIGSGPGTYSFPLAEAAGSVLCLDSSPRM